MSRSAAGGRGAGGLLRAGLRARSRLHLAVLTAAVLVVAAAVVGAVFAAAAEESILRDTVAQAGQGAAGVHLDAAITADDDTYPPSALDRLLAEAPAAGRSPSFPRRVPVMTLPTAVRGSGTLDEPSRLVWRDGFCAHLRVVAGRCPRTAGEAVISRRTSTDADGWALGGTMTAAGVGRLRIVGIYRPVAEDDPYWFGVDYFDGGLRVGGGSDPVLAADSVFVARSEFVDRIDGGVQVAIDYPVDPDAVVIGDGAGLRADLAGFRSAIADTPLTLRTGLPDVLRSAAAQRRYVLEGAGLVALQLVLLGSVVLFFVVLNLTAGRRREIALAKLRGQSPLAVARFALAEPLVVLAAALPLGLLIGWLAGAVLGALVLRPATPVLLPPAALVAAAAALAGAVAAAVVSTVQVLRRPVLEQWSDAEPRTARGARAVQAAVALGAAAAAVALLLLASTGSPTSVLVPALLLAAVALAGVPVAVAVARRWAPRSRASGRVARFLVVRRLARDRAARRTAALLVTTLGLAAFAVGGQSVLAGNRAARAEAELGAEQVVPVSPEVADPVAAVRRADPGGTWAMAAATWLPDGGLSVTGTVLGVDAERLAAVGLPARGGPDPAALARLVDASGAPELRVTGDRLTATLTTTALTGDRAPEVLLVVRTAVGPVVRAQAGALRAGTADYAAAVPCDRGCTFVGFVWTRPVTAEQAVGATVAVRGLAAVRDGRSTALPIRPTDRAAWRATPPVSESSDAVTVDSAGVRDRFRTASGEAGLTYAATTVPAPAVVTRQGVVPTRPDEGWRVVDQDLHALAFRPVRTVAILPSVLDDGVLMDVTALHRELPDFDATARWQVWLSRTAPTDALQRLDRVGLVPGTPTSVGQRESTLAREGPALAFSLLLALAVIAAVLAVLATAVSSGAAARGRSRESAAMRLIGVPPRTVLVAAVAEQVVLLGVAALLALPAGTVAVLLVLPLVRQSASATPVPLVDVPSAAPLLLLLLAYAVVVALMGAVTTRTVVRAGAPARLREVDG